VAAPTLIYCADGNARLAQIAIDAGFRYGAQLPNTIYHPPYFVDQDWRAPDRQAYMAALAEYRPAMASVLDLEREEQLSEVLSWAEEAAQFVQRVVIIPKAFGVISHLPGRIGDAGVVLGYSVPTRFAGTQVPVWEFWGWPVHLLGGAPQTQMMLACYLNVVSVDGNYAAKMALLFGQFWTQGDARRANNRYWPRLDEVGDPVDDDVPYEAFRRSCQNIMAAWRSL
jgi:hypothetical protein